jgi:hypothetical protein
MADKNRNRKTGGRWLIAAGSVLFSLAVFIALVELVHLSSKDGWHDAATAFDRELGWAPIPGYRSPLWGGIGTNSHGFRSGEIDPARIPVLLLGDSVAWGRGVSNKRSLARKLDKLVAGRGYQVHNLAVSGYGLPQEYLYLKRQIALFPRVDTAFLVLCSKNDLADTANFGYGVRRPMFQETHAGLELISSPVSRYCLRNLMASSRTGAWLQTHHLIPDLLSASYPGDIELSPEQAQRVSALLVQEIAGLVKTKGGRLVLAVSPSIDDFHSKSPELIWFEKYASSSGLMTVSLYDLFQAQAGPPEDYFNDDTHYSASANTLISQAFARKCCVGTNPYLGVEARAPQPLSRGNHRGSFFSGG